MMLMITNAIASVGGATGREKSNAHKTKSIWSIIGSKAPGARPIRRLIKAPPKSPINAPKESEKPSNGL